MEKIMFEAEAAKLQEIHNVVVAAIQEAKMPVIPVSARLCLDNLAVANMCMQQLAFVLMNRDAEHEQAVADAVKNGTVKGIG